LILGDRYLSPWDRKLVLKKKAGKIKGYKPKVHDSIAKFGGNL